MSPAIRLYKSTGTMKIAVDKGQDKSFLSDGRQTVEITHIEEGASEYKGTPFFAARFENEEGFVNQRFYLSAGGMPIIMSLLEAVGIEPKENKDIDTKELIGKKVSIEVGDYTYNNPEDGNERTIKQASNFESVK